jgi:hypothetical protein
VCLTLWSVSHTASITSLTVTTASTINISSTYLQMLSASSVSARYVHGRGGSMTCTGTMTVTGSLITASNLYVTSGSLVVGDHKILCTNNNCSFQYVTAGTINISANEIFVGNGTYTVSLINPWIGNPASAPTSGLEPGCCYFNSTLNTLNIWNGTAWKSRSLA